MNRGVVEISDISGQLAAIKKHFPPIAPSSAVGSGQPKGVTAITEIHLGIEIEAKISLRGISGKAKIQIKKAVQLLKAVFEIGHIGGIHRQWIDGLAAKPSSAHLGGGSITG